MNTFRVSTEGLDPHCARVRGMNTHDLGSNCLQRLSVGNKKVSPCVREFKKILSFAVLRLRINFLRLMLADSVGFCV